MAATTVAAATAPQSASQAGSSSSAMPSSPKPPQPSSGIVPTPTLSLKTPPSPSLNSNASILSFSMQPQEHRLMPLEEEKVFQQLSECDKIRYAAYRTAVKLDILQTALKLDSIKFGVVCNVFHQHGLSGGGAEDMETVLDRAEAREVISDVFYASSKVRSYYSPPMDVEALTEAALKYATLIFDSKGTGGIPVRSLKVFFVLMCEGRLRDKFLYLFRHFSDHSNSVMSRTSLSSLLNAVVQLPEFFGEGVSFGSRLVDCSVTQCLNESSGDGSAPTDQVSKDISGVSEDNFNRWLLKEPQIIVWLPTHFRLISSKGIRHGTRCSNCRMEDIIGMRYQCLRCINYDLCQHCFFHGLVSRGHKLEHPMQEYCYRSSKRDATKAFIKMLVNNLRKRKLSQMKQRYLHPTAATSMGGKKNAKSKGKKRRRRRRGTEGCVDAPSDDSSGFHSGSSSENGDSADGGAAKGSPRPTSTASSPGQNESSNGAANEPSEQLRSAGPAAATSPANDLDLTVIRQDGDQIVMSQHQKMFQSIVLNLEEQNNEMLSKLRRMQQQPDDAGADLADGANCEGMQMQLNRLKALMETVFSSSASTKMNFQGVASVSLTDPSVIESTPLPPKSGKVKKRAHFREGNFSPIVKSTAALPRAGNPPPPTEDMSPAPEDQHQQTSAAAAAAAEAPTLTEMSFGDISSLLVKTGRVPADPDPVEVEQANLTEQLTQSSANLSARDDETMEELESLMLQLEHVFQAFHEPKLVHSVRPANRERQQDLGNIMSEVGDLLDSFANEFTQHHELC